MDSSYLANQTEVTKLKDLIKQRDNEISILYRQFEKRYDVETSNCGATLKVVGLTSDSNWEGEWEGAKNTSLTVTL